MRKPAVVLLAVLAAALVAAGCGEKKENVGPPGKQKLTVVLDYLPNPDHVGFYAALRRGDFKRAGLNVDLKVPPDPSAPLKLLAAGKADLAISYEPEVLLARDQGLRVVSVGGDRPAPADLADGAGLQEHPLARRPERQDASAPPASPTSPPT